MCSVLFDTHGSAARAWRPIAQYLRTCLPQGKNIKNMDLPGCYGVSLANKNDENPFAR
jgi:hypothetical protein